MPLIPTSVRFSDIGEALDETVAPVLDTLSFPIAVTSAYAYILCRACGRLPSPEEIESFIRASADILNLHASPGGDIPS